MNKFKIIKINVFIYVLISIVFLLFISNKAYAVIGQSYNSMVTQYGQPKSVMLNRTIRASVLQRYQANGISVSGYKFTVNGFKMIALFNANNICYEMKTYNNRSLPDPKDLIGNLADTKPVVLHRIWLRSISLQYGTGANAVIYRTFGLQGNFSAVSYSPSLKP